MLGEHISHFRILAKIGEGGMGVVYRAEDENLGRHVALKVLRSDAVGDEERRLRFMREARSAAAVTHPHIATIHEIDEADGVIFIAMELVEGKTLAETIAGKPLPLRDALRYGIEITEAMARAHAAGVVHRDLKPENIVIDDDRHVKILDFGLAKIEEPEGSGEQQTRMQTISAEMTQAGRVLGTPAYMSPEQARGVAVDSRSDLFSFGVILYEMVTGALPFRGETTTDTLLAIVRDQPRAVSELSRDIPPELERIVAKCLEKAPQDRYQHADDVAVDLRRLKRDTDSQPVTRVSGPAPAVTGIRRFARPGVLLGILGLAVLAVAVPLLLRTVVSPARGGVRSLAVMPVVNLQDESDPERLGQILQELIITDLSELEALTVLSSQRLFDIQEQLSGSEARTIDRKLVSEVATRAGATTMLTGTLSRLESRWILACQLVNVADGSVIKSERVDGADLYTMVDAVTVRIRDDLGLGVESQESLGLAVKDKTTSSIEAYQLYLAGVDHLNARRYEEAVLELHEAVKTDAKFGKAYYKLAVADWWLSTNTNETWFEEHEVPTAEETLDLLLSGDIKLSTRERELAEAMRPLVTREYDDARAPYARLVERYPDEKETWYGLGEAEFHAEAGSAERALEAFEKALELDPSFQIACTHIFDLYGWEKKYAEAAARARTLVEMNPENTTWYADWILALIHAGDAEAESVIGLALENIPDAGDRRRLLRNAASGYSAVGQDQRRLECLQQALDIESSEVQAELLAEMGSVFFDRRDHAKAMDLLLKAHDADPEHLGTYWRLGSIYRNLGRFADGILRFRNWSDQNPGLAWPPQQWIELAVFRGDDDEVARAIETSLEREEREDARDMYHRVAGDAYRNIGNYPRAREHLDRAIELDPESNIAKVGRARVDLGLRDYEAAEKRLRAVLEEDPGYDDALWSLVDCLLASRQYSEALELVRAPDPKEFRINSWIRRARVLVLAGRLQEADALLEELRPKYRFPWEERFMLTNTASAHMQAGNLTRAETLVRQARERHVGDQMPAWLVSQLAEILEYQGKYDEAAKALAEIRKTQPLRHRTGLEEARLLVRRGDSVGAEKKLRAYLERGPDILASELLVCALAAQERFQEALPIARSVAERKPVQLSHTLLSWVLIAGDLDLQEGIDLAERALGMPGEAFSVYTHPFHPSPRHCLGLAYLKQGDRERAAGMLEAAAAERPDRALIREHLEQARGGT